MASALASPAKKLSVPKGMAGALASPAKTSPAKKVSARKGMASALTSPAKKVSALKGMTGALASPAKTSPAKKVSATKGMASALASSVKKVSAPKGMTLKAKVLELLRAHRPCSTAKSMWTLAKVNCCSSLFHGVQAQLNRFADGNNGFRVSKKAGRLKEDSVYLVNIEEDNFDPDDDEFDDYTAGQVLDAKFVGSVAAFKKMLQDAKLSRSTMYAVTEMLTYNSESDSMGEESDH